VWTPTNILIKQPNKNHALPTTLFYWITTTGAFPGFDANGIISKIVIYYTVANELLSPKHFRYSQIVKMWCWGLLKIWSCKVVSSPFAVPSSQFKLTFVEVCEKIMWKTFYMGKHIHSYPLLFRYYLKLLPPCCATFLIPNPSFHLFTLL